MAENQEPTVKIVERVVAVLSALSDGGAQGTSLADLCDITGLRKATAHRLLAALTGSGFAFQDIDSRRYRLGFQAASLGLTAAAQCVAGPAMPVLGRLAATTGDTVFASIREGLAAICVARAVGGFPIRTLTLDVGDRRPLGVGAGSLALLAFFPDSEIEMIVNRNERWLQDFQRFAPEEMSALITRTRRDGFALNEGRIVPGMNAIGVPVLDATGRPLASLSLAAIRDRMGPERLPELVQNLQAEARVLAEVLTPRALAAQ
ncbi:IclR family transcriptional regulator [Paramagnetospirillum kuznetsovii]|uniref:IclR family transcriptional regulator n=1 Tax=Paramagnetospirillum kuznetsovii TaxID=2053833 RepID=A0A364NW53_9PROT|nr:IclR family transcriptional regulator [Paramagnetospirillum kuznetsovii]RAU21311.1 IclR family transcriptional regulator [Paramagnetospirillum kuznetsovii]